MVGYQRVTRWSDLPMRFQGRIDVAEGLSVSGWVFDTERPGEPVEIVVQIDGIDAFMLRADMLRSDLAKQGFGAGKHGFSLRLPGMAATDSKCLVGVLALPGRTPLENSPVEISKLRYRRASEKDIINGYRFFLGRDPESPEVVASNVGSDLLEFLHGLVASREFDEKVRQPIRIGAQPFEGISAAIPDRCLIAWVTEQLNLPGSLAHGLAAARSWACLYALLLAEDGDHGLFGSPSERADLRAAAVAAAERTNRTLDGRLAFGTGFRLLGSIDANSVGGLPVSVNLFVGPHFLAAVQCIDVARITDNRGYTRYRTEFVYQLHDWQLERLAAGRQLRAVEASSGRAIGVPLELPPLLAAKQADVLKLQHELDQLKRSLSTIEDLVRTAQAQSALSIENYDMYRELFYDFKGIGWAPSVASQKRRHLPSMSVVLPVISADARGLADSIESVRNQTYPRWQLLIVCDAGSMDEAARSIVSAAANAESRILSIETQAGDDFGNLAAAAFVHADGDYVTFLATGDMITTDALFQFAMAARGQRYHVLYADHDHYSQEGDGRKRFSNPHLKPGFDYDLLLGGDYIGWPVAFARERLLSAGGLASGLGRCALYDLTLRLFEAGAGPSVGNVERVLYHRRLAAAAEPETGLAKAPSDCQTLTVARHLARVGSGRARPHHDPLCRDLLGHSRIDWPLGDPAPRVAIVIPTRDRAEVLGPCLHDVLAHRERYAGQIDVLVVDNGSVDAATRTLLDRFRSQPGCCVASFPGRFNWGSFEFRVGYAACGLIRVKSSFPAMRKSTVRMVANRV